MRNRCTEAKTRFENQITVLFKHQGCKAAFCLKKFTYKIALSACSNDYSTPILPPNLFPLKPNFANNDDTSVVRATWIGHATVLAEIGGTAVITDPIFSDRASMFSFAGPKR